MHVFLFFSVTIVIYSVRCFATGQTYINDFRKLTYIPTDIPHDTKKIYLNNNCLVNIESGAFAKYSQCTKISLDWNRLTEVRNDMWTGLLALEWLSLEHNEIKHIGPSAFADLPNLKGLYLHNNRLTTLPGNIFPSKQMPTLEILTLHENSLKRSELGWLHKLCDKGQVQEYTIGEQDVLCRSSRSNDNNNNHKANGSNVAQLEHNTQGETRFSSWLSSLHKSKGIHQQR